MPNTPQDPKPSKKADTRPSRPLPIDHDAETVIDSGLGNDQPTNPSIGSDPTPRISEDEQVGRRKPQPKAEPPRQVNPRQPTPQAIRIPPAPSRQDVGAPGSRQDVSVSGSRPDVSAPRMIPPRQRIPTKPVAAKTPIRGGGCRRTLTMLSLLTFVGLACGLFSGVVGYIWIATQLPPANELKARSVQFATTQILDREGNLLWEIIDPNGGRRTLVSLNQISPHLIQATIDTEDSNFRSNVGVDPIGIARALYYNFLEGDIVVGGSTITQQLARNVLLPEERTARTFSRKIREAVLAVEISRRYSKDEILEIYLNQIYYGNMAYGIEAASQTYFGKSAAELNLAEASLLGGLPQSPAIYDPYVNLEGAKKRQADVLRLMVQANDITPEQAKTAFDTELTLQPFNFTIHAPHFVNYVRQELEKIVPPEYIYQAGLRVQTTLDPRLQETAETIVQQQVDNLAGLNVTNGALVALNVTNGQILAMVGSKDFNDAAISGQVNLVITPRQVGSTMKPLTYLAGFEKLNWTPSTLFMDVPVQYPDGAGGVYQPRNYDGKFHGPVSLRVALANSYNIPAVKALEQVQVDGLKQMATRLGITTLTRNDYGLALGLGSGEVPLIEMTSAYQTIANQGVRVPPTAIMKITDSLGRVIEPTRPPAQPILNPNHAYLMTHILADNQARSAAFGTNSVLRLSFPAAVKTGTTNDYRDNWTIGFSPDIVTGVWTGNSDNSPMQGVSGVAGAGPIWHDFMEAAHSGLPVKDFVTPAEIVQIEVCADSGTLPSPVCPERRREIFYSSQPPLGPEKDIHQIIRIDRASGLLANEFCQNNVEEQYYRVYPPDGKEWAASLGIPQPPETYCPAANIVAKITSPLDGAIVSGKVTLQGAATAANFSYYQIELGVGTNPQAFMPVQGAVWQLNEGGTLGEFDSAQIENGPYTLRVLVYNQFGNMQEARVRVLVNNALPTATPTPTEQIFIIVPTDTPTPIPTSTTPPTPLPPTPTFVPTSTPAPQIIPTDTPIVVPPTDTPDIPAEPPTETPMIMPDAPSMVIVSVNKIEEYVEVQNAGQQLQDITGWVILSEQGGEACRLEGSLAPAEVLRVWALATQAGGYNCGFSGEIWLDNEADAAVLYDPQGVEQSRVE